MLASKSDIWVVHFAKNLRSAQGVQLAELHGHSL